MDGKRRNVLKMDLPKQGGKAFVIPVKSSGSAVKRPKVFSRPILSQADLPYETLTEGWDEALRNLKLRAREWKYFLEAYAGASSSSEAPPPLNNVPSLRMGPGGYDPEDFADAPDADPGFCPLRTGGITPRSLIISASFGIEGRRITPLLSTIPFRGSGW